MNKKILTVEEALTEMESINLSNLRGPVHRELVKDTIMAAKACEAVEQNLSEQLATLEAAYAEELDASIIEETIQRLTKEIYDLSDARSQGQTTLKSGLRAVMGMPGEAEKTALASELFALMHKYDLHTGMNVDEQTAIIDSFIADVEQNYPQAMQTIGLTVLYQQLKDLNEAVCQKVYERDDAKVGLGTGRMEAARIETDKAWRQLRAGVNFMASTNDEPYAHFIGHMNELIIRYKRVHLKQKVESPEVVPGGPGSSTEEGGESSEGGSSEGEGSSTEEGGNQTGGSTGSGSNQDWDV